MALKVTSRDIQEIVSKLSSDKAKAREEGVKLLNTWLETDRSFGFCRYLSDKTSVLKPNEVPHSETWPFLVKILMQCASSEISSSKKRLPKSIFAKTLRIIVQRAQDDGCSEKSSKSDVACRPALTCRKGKKNLLLHVAKSLFNHVWDVLKDVPSFQSEYGVILRYLLEVTYYRFHMRKRVYSNLVLLYMEKVETSLSTENFGQINPKEEVFRFTLTLHSLIENPPGDIPDDLRDNIISGFVGIFSHVRDEGKISRKLVECINTYLLKDGPNLGGKSLEIHQAVNHFVFRYWFATHDRSLKDSLICYAKLQVSLTRGVDDGSILLELVDVMSKELDQMSTSSTNSPWGEKCGIMTSSQFKVAELAALVFCRVCANTYKSPGTEKRARREHVVVLIKERVVEGKWPWHAALVCLIRNYSTRIRKDHLLFWFDNISANFERIINAATLKHSYDDLFWTLQSLLRLSLLMLFAAPNEKSSQKLAFPMNEDNENKLHELSGPLYEVGKGWHVIWNCLMRSLPTFCNLTSIVDAAFMLLCSIMLSDTKDSYLVPLEIWDLRLFKRTLSMSALCFISCYFSRRTSLGDLQDFLYLRQNVLPAVLAILNLKEFTTLNERFVVLLPAAAYALSTGSTPLLYDASGLLPLLYATEPMEELAKIEESPSDFLECSVEVLAKIDIDSGPKVNLFNYCQNVRLPLNLRDQLLHEMENHVLECIKEVEIDKMLLSEVIYTCALLSNFMFCSYSTRKLSMHSQPASSLVFLQTYIGFVNSYENLKFPCSYILDGICCLVTSLLQSNGVGTQNTVASSFTKRESEECLTSLGDLVTKVFDNSLFDWYDRAKLVNCICNFVLLRPQLAQLVIDKLFMLLRDPDYRVRLCLARRIGVLFQTWDGHSELFQDVCSNFGRKLVTSSGEKTVRAQEVLSVGPQPRPIMETIVVTLMHLVLHSERIELEAVFMISVVAAIDPSQRELVSAVLDSLSKEACYTNRTKFLEELMGPILFNWVACGVSLVALVEARDIFTSNLEPMNFIKYCCPWLLPALILQEDANSLKWVAKVACQPCAALVKSHFVHIFSVCMAMHCSKKAGWERGSRVLETSILLIVNISEHERDELIKKQMVSIVNHTLSLASNSSDCPLPFFSKDTIACTIQTIVDGFLDSEEHSKSFELVDKINIFRPDRVFMFIVDLHYKIAAAAHHWHKCNHLAGIEVLVNLLGHRAVIPSTFNYLLNLIGQFIGCDCLLDQCCCIISTLLNISRDYPSEETIRVLGEQLQFLVSELVACCIPCGSNKKLSVTTSSRAVLLLQQLTIGADSSMVEYIKELVAFPEFDIFNEIRDFHQKIRQTYSPRVHLLNFVKRPHYVPPRLLLCSLKALHKNIGSSGIFLGDQNDFKDAYWHSENEIFHAAWKLVPLCSLDNTNDLSAMVSDFISKIGIGDPHRVVFHLPGDYSVPVFGITIGMGDTNIHADTGISEEALLVLMRLLKKYLMDDSVEIIDMASQALRGILSTENGQRALMQLDSYERSLIEVHSKGVNLELVQRLISNLQRKLTAESISIEDSNVWTTLDKTFEAWICPLVYAVIGYCNDLILRLCQDIVLVKSEVAEFLFPYVIVNVAGRMDLDVDLCKLISLKVQENIFNESNASIKSIQIFLHALNELRLCHVTERKSSVVPQKQESSKQTKSPSYGSKSRVASAKMKDQQTTSCRLSVSTLCWEKVYWLSVDYLMAAKSAIKCGSYFSAVLYVEYWCEEHFNSLTLGSPDFSPREMLQSHIEILASAVTQINEPDSLYGIIQSHKLSSQITIFQHEGNWSKALEYLDLQARFELMPQMNGSTHPSSGNSQQPAHAFFSQTEHDTTHKKPYKGLVRSLQQIGCTHVLDVYCQGLTTQTGRLQHDLEFAELQYEAAWRAGNWDFCSLYSCGAAPVAHQPGGHHFNENLHGCLRALQEGDYDEFYTTLRNTKQDLLMSIFHASKESTEYIYSTLVKLQIFYHLGMAWDLRWNSSCEKFDSSSERQKLLSEPVVPSMDQLKTLHKIWIRIFKQAELHMNMLEPFIAFRRVLLQVLNSSDSTAHHLLESASILRKGCRTSQAAAALHEFKYLCSGLGEEYSNLYWLGRLEEAKLLRAQGQHEMAINLADHISQNRQLKEDAADVFRLVGKWLAETRSSNSRTILEKYLKRAVVLAGNHITTEKLSAEKRSQMHFNLAHYADALFRSHEERLNSNEWHVAIRLRKHKTKELEALLKRLKTSKGDKIDYSLKIQELQKQLSMDKGEAEKLQEDRDKFLSTAVEGYKQCLIIGDKYDVQVVFRLVSMWFSLTNKEIAIDSMLSTIKEVQSYKFIPLVYQIASRMGGNKDSLAPKNFQFALVSLVKKMALDHPYHTIFQLLALANGDRIKDKQRSRNSFVVDVDKKVAAEDLLRELSAYHGAVISQMKQMVEIYIKLAELETKREDTNKKVALPRELRSIRELELVPVVTSNFPVDQTCQYPKGFFPHFRGLADSVTIMNGINAPKVVECLGSDGMRYRQLAKSGNDDLRQDAVMEQFFGLVNTFLQKNRDTWKRRLIIRTYKVVPFTPSAGVLEWVNGTVPLGEYLIGSSRNGGAHGRYGVGDWTFLKCRQHVTAENNKSRAFLEVCKNFRPVMHYFFLERFRHPADWFDKRLAYTRSVAASSMVGYIVGLGDRHSMNVLIDQSSAEVVHIDLGVAFEQGLMLKTPERVPFRLTRDIIDGMGVTGVEGVFRRCCEEALSVMRTNKEALLTIIEVFIHDPLYKWALSPLKAMQRQKDIDDDLDANLEDSDEDEYEGNKDAARALLRVKQKLDGYEDGEMRSVHGQVQQLIQDAIDPDRLCHMFPGWGAWL
ncbi:serine/threonine-protein kinase ATM isoform X33 [Primulina eburnea]|uniref:serine/threonine-protein kinase ATM isoform X33 n=1 Tax=Primulina eburnea TaxID=1245227 RepID=UPI003C6C25CE